MSPADLPAPRGPRLIPTPTGLSLALTLACAVGWAAPAQSQQARQPSADTIAAAVGPDRPSPGGAFLRSVLVPGWGQAASGSYGRAAFYLLAQAGNTWMTYKTESMLQGAQRRQDAFEAVAEAEFLRGGGDPDSIAAALEADPRVEDARTLTEARSEQKEDWVALLVFFAFLGGADAFVSAHLADFPVPLTVEPTTGPGGAAIEIGAAIPIPSRRTRGSRR